MKKTKLTNAALFTVAEFLNAVKPQDVVDAFPKLGYKAIIRVENVYEDILEVLTPYKETINEADKRLAEERAKNPDLTEQEATAIVKGLPYWEKQKEEVELELTEEKHDMLIELLKQVSAKYFNKKDVLVELFKAFGVE